MTRKDLPFQPWGIKAIAEGRKLLTSRCSGLAAVNRNPDEWEYGGENVHGQHIFYSKDDSKDGLLLRCPWVVGQVYPPANVLVTGIAAKRVQDMTEEEVEAEGIEWTDNGLGIYQWRGVGRGGHKWNDYAIDAFESIWDSIHRRDVNNRHHRNPWTWRLAIKATA